jgi:hypothetical protein
MAKKSGCDSVRALLAVARRISAQLIASQRPCCSAIGAANLVESVTAQIIRQPPHHNYAPELLADH